MKSIYPARKQRVPAGAAAYAPLPEETLAYADSAEAMEAHYRSAVERIETQLATLSLGEHARQITALCTRAISLKNKLNNLLRQQQYQ